MNFDRAIFKNIDPASLGIVIRYSNGEVMGAMSQHVPLPQTVMEVEALACRCAVSFAIELGLRELVIEGDSALVIQAIKDGKPCQSSMATLWMTFSIYLLSYRVLISVM